MQLRTLFQPLKSGCSKKILLKLFNYWFFHFVIQNCKNHQFSGVRFVQKSHKLHHSKRKKREFNFLAFSSMLLLYKEARVHLSDKYQ